MELDLHRSGRAPDWAAVSESDWNIWQRLAAHTHGICTPANALTVCGFGISMWGVGALLGHHWWLAILLLTLGRLVDILDGVVANATGTKSPLGELLDAGVDKIITVLTVAGMFIAQAAPTWLMGLFVLPQLIIVVITIVDRVRRVELHPSRLGKTTMLLAWISIPLLLLTRAMGVSLVSPVGALITLFVLVASAFGFITANSYLAQSHVSHLQRG